RMWLESEAAVRASGLPWTILRPSGYQSNALRWLPQLQRGDVVSAPWPDVPIAAIDPADIAAVAAAVLTGPGHEGTALTLSGPQPLTPGDQVKTPTTPLNFELQESNLMADKFTRKSQEALADAVRRATAEGNPHVDPLHLLVALIELNGGTAAPL